MADHGFVREDRAGYLLVGHYHPDIPTIGVQLVSGRLFEGRTDPQRITLLPIEDGGTIALAPIEEDMIADRLGQYAASRQRDLEMLAPARLLLKLAGDLDHAELGDVYGVSRERVRQIEVRAFEKLQKSMLTAAANQRHATHYAP